MKPALKSCFLKSLITFTCFLLLFIHSANCQDFNYRVNALYIYNFTKYVDWGELHGESLTIGVIGNSPVHDQLRSILTNKKVYGKNFVVKMITPEEAPHCQLIIISKEKVALTQQISDRVKDLPILVITEKQGYTRKGAQICLYVDDEDRFKTKFELSRVNLKSTRLKVSNELISLAEIVN